MKDYYNLIPDKTRLLTGNFTKGRGGVKPNMIVRHHFAGIGDTDWLWRVWQGRAASAHYGVESGTDVVGQLVYDDDTAWHAANAAINRRSYGLEHGNITGRVGGRDDHPDSWKIADDTIKAGARLAAALCLKDGMGMPEWGKNVTDHRTHYGTSCPLKLARGGIYDQPWFDEATWFYNQLDKKLVHPDGTPISTFTTTPAPTPEEELDMSAVEELKNYLDARVTGPIGSDVKDVRQQLTGGRDAGQYPGWDQIDDRSIVDALAVIGEKLGIPGFHDPHGGSLKAKQDGE